MKWYKLTDYYDYMDVDVKNKILIIHPKPVRNNGYYILTDESYAKVHPKTMDEYLTKNRDRIKEMWKIEKIIRLDK